jgi:hypothetical protein
MPTILTRAGNGSELTHNELDANFKRTCTQVTADYQVLVSNNRETLEGNHASTPIVFTMPTVSAAGLEDTDDFEVTFTNIGVALVSITGSGSETINGVTSSLVLNKGSAVTIALDAAQTGWQITSRSGSTLGTMVATTSGTAVDFTGIPEWVKKVIISFDAVSTDGTEEIIVQLGDSGGFETTGYLSLQHSTAVGSTSTTDGFYTGQTSAASYTITGQMTLVLMDIATFRWSSSGLFLGITAGAVSHGGRKTLTSVLTQIRITSSGTPDTFDSGNVNILYE